MDNYNLYGENVIKEGSDVYYKGASWETNNKPSQGNGLAIAGMVLGIISAVILLLTFCCFPFYGSFFATPFAIIGLILSIVALKKRQSKGMCLAGIICSAITLVAAVASLVILLMIVFGIATTEYSDIINTSSDLYYGWEEMFY